MQKLFIKNRKSQKLAVLLEEQPNTKGLAFVMHGLGGFKEQPHLVAIAEAFLESGYTVVRFDTANTFGESGGNYEDATTTDYYEDLEDVIGWARAQAWYQEPFVLMGHSLGGLCVALFAERHPEKVQGLAPISTVVSGKLSTETPSYRAVAEEWQKTGWRVEESKSRPGAVKRLKWSHVADRLKYDLLPDVRKLTMSVLLIVGEKDDSTPPAHQEILFKVLPGPKEFYVIAGAPHTFRDEKHLKEIQAIFKNWIKKLS